MKINPLYLLTLLACGCLSDAATFPSRPVEFIELDRHPTPEVERSSPAPSGDAQKQTTPVVINLYSADWCGPCKQHEAYWQARGWKGDGFKVKKVATLPDWVETIPVYHWNGKTGPLYVQCGPEQLQAAFDQTPKAGK